MGRYELLGRLGDGGQGIVYLARDPAGDRQVAVKLLRAHLSQDEASRSRFLQEVALAKRVARFCTAQVLDADMAGTQPYIVSEYIPGPSLSEVVRSGGPRTGTALERIAVNTATALAGIHQAGIIHRDFKAANVLLGPDGPVVIDFGIAKVLDAVHRELTLTGQSPGTIGYMAPEQVNDEPVGPPADIFAWGVTIAFAATGAMPFGSGDISAVLYRILHEPPRLDGLGGPLRDLVAACLDKDPAARPSARDIVDRLLGPQDLTGLTGPLPASGNPSKAVRMRYLHEVTNFSEISALRAGASGSRRTRLVVAGSVAAVALLLAGGGAVMALTGSPGPGAPAPGQAAADGLPSASSRAASPAVSPGTRGTAHATTPGTAHASARTSARARPAKSHTAASPAPGRSSPAHGSSGTGTPPPQPTSPPPSQSSVPNPYTPTQVCGSGYSVVDSHALTGGTIYLLYDSATGKNCVTTMRSYVSGKIGMAATLTVQGGPSSSDSGSYSYYAGPVALPAAATCVEWGGTIGSSSWTSNWSHCG